MFVQHMCGDVQNGYGAFIYIKCIFDVCMCFCDSRELCEVLSVNNDWADWVND